MGFYFIYFFPASNKIGFGCGPASLLQQVGHGVCCNYYFLSPVIYPSKHAELSASLLSFTTAVALVIINSGRQLCERGYSLQLEASVLS